MKRTCILVLAILLGAAGAAYAPTLKPEPGWVTGEHTEKAVAAAKKRNRILCFLWAWHESYWRTTAKRYMRNSALGGMVKVLVYVSRKPPQAMSKVMDQVARPDIGTPIMYFATPDDLVVLAFVQSDSRPDKVSRMAGLAKKVFAWRNSTRKDVARADKLAEAGKFKAARQIYERVVKEDLGNTVIVHKTWDAVVKAEEIDGFYFPDVPDKIDALEGKAEERLEKAEEQFEKGEYAKAKEMVEPMVKDAADFEAVKKAAKLLENVEEKLKSTKK
ncbi:MAG: hypothetical protein AMS16_01270 [Planctomycetes bacterium DG_58]|nr:MAG: hypothetical protein AMS16_01270 [Planctomycetes bacterium DG_58]KPL04973.1 MAG: hypothetical protein AMK75_00060 [Planctomycetes bacterium SM23_65]